MNLYGSIGYTLLKNNKNTKPEYILILADMHSKLPYCNNYINIADWFDTQKYKINILLEEVPRGSLELRELFAKSDHTKSLKQLFINNSDLIHALDIRPFLIPFSWEILMFDNIDNNEITLLEYCDLIDNFFNFTHPEIKIRLNEIYTFDFIKNTKLNNHFKLIYNNYLQYLTKYKQYLDIKIILIFQNKNIILQELNNILDQIMEFYTLCKIYQTSVNNKNVIIHTGLSHSEKILEWLLYNYNYKILTYSGINLLKYAINTDIKDGCVNIKNVFNKI